MHVPKAPRSPFHYVLTLVALVIVGSLSCSDDPTAPEEPTESNVSVESSNREVATIGPSGGSVTTTSDAGVTYTLDVPPGAVPGDIEIAITPVTAIDNLPFSGRLEGGVRLGPSGLHLLVPALLTIDRAPSTSGTERLLGFSYEGDADSFEPAAAIDGTTEIRVPITHFSGAGAASSGDSEDWLATLCASVPTLDYTFTAQMDMCWRSTDVRREYFFRVARDYLEDILTPLAQRGGELSVAVTEYIEWYHGCDALAAQFQATDWEDVLATEIETIAGLIEEELVTSVAFAKLALCELGGSERLRRVFEYRHLAFAAGFQETTGLRDEDILEDLCAEIRIPEITLADPLPMNQGTSLDVRAELWINNQREDALFNFTVNPVSANVTCAGGSAVCEGRSNGLGEYTVVVMRTGPGLIEIDVFARLLMTLFVTNQSEAGYALVDVPLRQGDRIVRESYSIAATFPSNVESGVATTLTAVVTRDNPGGIPTPIEGVQVTFDADGGTANPTNGTTDASGSVQTEVTAQNGPNRVVVEIDAYLDGEVVATKFVEASIGNDPQPASFQLLRRSSYLSGVEVAEGCTGQSDPFKLVEVPGDFTIDVFGNETCVDLLGEGETTATRYRSVDTDLRSDTGLSSGVILIDSDGTIAAELTCSGNTELCGSEYASVAPIGEVTIEFRIADPVNFEFDGTHTAANNSQFLPQFTVTRIDGGRTDEKMNWSGREPNSWDGTLEPGDYRVLYRFADELRAYLDPINGNRQDFWWDTGLTLKLTKAPAAAAGSR